MVQTAQPQEETPAAPPSTTPFSMALNEDQLQIQKWVHGFAKDVMRPAAHEWDEREETPWPIIQEAAKI
ncbi:MAG TPA: acyl-CoA dehydrogenase family protein, partial [Dehalococcoidia bacterium]|nr:acyl-CoA dehydrogenase family protein [Dehalococcoidia bacterium]